MPDFVLFLPELLVLSIWEVHELTAKGGVLSANNRATVERNRSNVFKTFIRLSPYSLPITRTTKLCNSCNKRQPTIARIWNYFYAIQFLIVTWKPWKKICFESITFKNLEKKLYYYWTITDQCSPPYRNK